MSILDKTKIGNSVQINLELTKDRFTKEVVDAINASSVAKISDFRITDGKGIGVILKLSNGKEQWFFEDEIYLLDENGNVIKENNDNKENSNFIYDFLKTASRILFIEIVNTLKNTKNRPNQPIMTAIDNKLEPKSSCINSCI